MEYNENLLITVIVITTNREKTICDTLESIRKNQENFLNVKLYDFCSEDHTVSIVKDYIERLGLNWNYDVLNEKLRDCQDWHYALENEGCGWITFLEGDDCWPAGFCSKVYSIINANPTVGLIHFAGFNEKGYQNNGYERDTFFSSSDYMLNHLINNVIGSYAPSQTIFKKNNTNKKINFNFNRFKYAPEPSFWLELSLQCDVFICISMAVYRGISETPRIKLDAILDLLSYAEDLLTINPPQRGKIIWQVTFYIILYHYIAYFYSVIRLRQKICLDFFTAPIAPYIRLLFQSMKK